MRKRKSNLIIPKTNKPLHSHDWFCTRSGKNICLPPQLLPLLFRCILRSFIYCVSFRRLRGRGEEFPSSSLETEISSALTLCFRKSGLRMFSFCCLRRRLALRFFCLLAASGETDQIERKEQEKGKGNATDEKNERTRVKTQHTRERQSKERDEREAVRLSVSVFTLRQSWVSRARALLPSHQLSQPPARLASAPAASPPSALPRQV